MTFNIIDYYSEPSLPDFSAGVTPPSGVLQPSGSQYLHHGGVGGHQSTFTPPQLLQQGITYYVHYSTLLSVEVP